MVHAFALNRSVQEMTRMQQGQAENDAYLQYCETLALLAHQFAAGSTIKMVVQDADESVELVMQLKDLRQMDDGTPLFELQFIYNTRYCHTPIIHNAICNARLADMNHAGRPGLCALLKMSCAVSVHPYSLRNTNVGPTYCMVSNSS